MAEHREKHGFDHWPKRGDPLRATVVPQLSKSNKEEMNNNTLSRCRSLEYLDERKPTDKEFDHGKGNFHRSFDLLNNMEQHEAIIHHSMMTDLETSKSSSMQHSTNTSESGRASILKQYPLDFREKCGNITHSTLSAESLEDFTCKTKEMIQMKRAMRQKSKEKTMSELRDRQKVDSSFLKYPPNFSSTLMSNSIDDLHDYHSSNHYPNDFDDISVEMKNITKLLSASLIEPLESAPSTSSSFYQSTDKLAKRFTLYDKDGEDDDEHDTLANYPNSYGNNLSGLSVKPPSNGLTTNGFFQNTCFENRSSSSCDTLKSMELPKTNGKTDINGDDVVVDDDDDEESTEGVEDEEEESDTELDTADEQSIKTPPHLQNYTHRNPRPGLVSARIKSLLSKNLQTVNKRPTVRSTLVGNSSNFKSSKLLRLPLKSNDPQKSPTNSISTTINTMNTNPTENSLEIKKTPTTGGSSDNEVQITVHKATVHANQMHANSMN